LGEFFNPSLSEGLLLEDALSESDREPVVAWRLDLLFGGGGGPVDDEKSWFCTDSKSCMWS